MAAADAIHHRASFDFIRYANCWEDADILCDALQPAPGKRILSIASGGDNAFALAAEGAEVIAVDLNPSQLACVELKKAAFDQLSHDDLLAFLGVNPHSDRVGVYTQLEKDLTEPARSFWQANQHLVADGFIHGGKFERYFHLFRRRVLPWVHSRRQVQQLLEEKDEAGRKAFYDKTWNGLRWRGMFKLFFSRFVMGRLGRDPEFFRYVEGSVGDRILERTHYALTALATHSNPYLRYILTGNYATEALPRYLEPARFDAVRDGMSRIHLFQGPLQDAAAILGIDRFDGFNLSDVFEYIDDPAAASLYAKLLSQSAPGARLAYWNMLVPRHCPDNCRNQVTPLSELAESLFNQDKAFFYSAFRVDEVRS